MQDGGLALAVGQGGDHGERVVGVVGQPGVGASGRGRRAPQPGQQPVASGAAADRVEGRLAELVVRVGGGIDGAAVAIGVGECLAGCVLGGSDVVGVGEHLDRETPVRRLVQLSDQLAASHLARLQLGRVNPVTVAGSRS